jgi:predicted TIM-barrel fold metal-dependent hydrolase
MESSRGLDIVDAQVHLFGESDARYPWDPAVLADPSLAAMRERFLAHVPDASVEAMLAEMDAQGVQGALVVTPAIYGYDNSYSVDAYRSHPDRFRVVGRVDSSRADVAETLEAWEADPAFVGLRLNLWAPAAVERFLAGADDSMLAAAARAGLRVCVNAPGRFDLQGRIARMFPDLPLVIDHLGLFAMPMLDPGYGDTFAGLDGLIALAAFEQVAVKLTSLPLLSREPYPHADVWPHVHRVIEAFGPGRLMWGSDHTVFEHDYGESVDLIRATDELGPADKEQILGEALRRVWGWPREERTAQPSAERASSS